MADVALDEFVRRALTAPDRAGRVAVLKELVQIHRGKRSAADVISALGAEGRKGRRLALEFLARLPAPIPLVAMIAAGPLLSNRKNPTFLRLAAAGRVLGSVPDTPDAVRPVVGWLTVGLSRPRALSRLFALQCRVRKCDTLDGFVTAAEKKLTFRCPRCPAKLTKGAFLKHLWNTHRLEFSKGKVRDPARILDEAVTAGAKPILDDPEPLDRTFAVAAIHYPEAPPSQTLQAVASRAGASANLEPLIARAAKEHAGLCPNCLATVPDPVPAMPPPLPLGSGRLAGEGWSVSVVDSPTGRKVVVESPGVVEPGATPQRRFAPRLAATLITAPILLVSLILAVVVPVPSVSPLLLAGWIVAVAWLVYLAVRFLRTPLPSANDIAVDRAWEEVVPGIGRKPAAIRFLARLCRTSLRAGTPGNRTRRVWDTVEHATILADKGWPHQQWLGAARVLQAADGGKVGKERVAALAGIFEPFLRGETSIAYADAAAEALLGAGILGPGEGERLAVLLVGMAYLLGFTAADLLAITRFAPQFRRLLPPADDQIRRMFVIWRVRTKKPWAEYGTATHVFDLADNSPVASRQILGEHPDTLLRIAAEEQLEKEVGPILLCGSGLVVGGKTVSDAAAPVEVTKSTHSAGWDLKFGPHRISLERRPPTKFANDLRGWLRFWASATQSTSQADRVNPDRLSTFLAPISSSCPLCAVPQVVRVGRFGVKWEDVRTGQM